MEITSEQLAKIESALPLPRGKSTVSMKDFLNAILYVAENGCKWRALPAHFGNWHTIYTRLNRWAKNGTLDRIFTLLQQEQILQIKVVVYSLESTAVKAYPDETGAHKKMVCKPSESHALDGAPKFIWLPRMSEQP